MNGTTNPWLIATLILLVTTTTGIGVSFYFYQSYTSTDNLYRDTLETVNELNEAYQNLSSALQDISDNLTTTTQKLQDVSYNPKLLIKYENGTEVWYNHTRIPIGWTLFNATLKITDGNMEYQQFAFGVFITSIHGVTQNHPNFWLWYLWNSTAHSWTFGPIGADAYRLKSGDAVAWYLTDGSATP
jgi:hypothetical protein